MGPSGLWCKHMQVIPIKLPLTLLYKVNVEEPVPQDKHMMSTLWKMSLSTLQFGLKMLLF